MRKLVFLLLVSLAASAAHGRSYFQAELDALLAPVALYPDVLVTHVLIAASYPDQVRDAARGAPPQPHWHPSVTALRPYPDLLARMAESPHWMRDLAEAYVHQQAQVMFTVQSLRSRSQGRAPSAAVPPPVVVYQAPVVVYQTPLIVHHHHHPVFPRFVHRPHHRPHHGPHHAPHHRTIEAHRRPIINSTPQLFHKPQSQPQARQHSRGAGIFHKPR